MNNFKFIYVVLLLTLGPYFFVSAEKYNQPTILFLEFQKDQWKLDVKMKASIIKYCKETNYLANPETKIQITLFPEEPDFYNQNNRKKYNKRANALMDFIRNGLAFNGEVAIFFARKEEFVSFEQTTMQLKCSFFVITPVRNKVSE